MAQKIQLRRGPAAAWTAANPVLRSAEAGFETDTKKLKIGDGATAWNALAYFGHGVPSGGTTGQVLAKSADGDFALVWADPTLSPNFHNVFNNDEKNGLTGMQVGDFAVIRGEAGRLEQYVPNDVAAQASVSGAGGSNGYYAPVGLETYLRIGDDPAEPYTISNVANIWELRDSDNSLVASSTGVDPVAFPWEATWDGGVTMTRAPSPDIDWAVIRNTVEIQYLTNWLAIDVKVGGVLCLAGNTTYVGWVDPAALPIDDSVGSISATVTISPITNTAIGYASTFTLNTYGFGADVISLPRVLAPKSRVTVVFDPL